MHEIRIPQLGQEVEEVVIVQWLKGEGEAVVKGEPLFTVQTDKADIECEATASGVLRKILLEPGAVAPILSVAAYVGNAGEPIPSGPAPVVASAHPGNALRAAVAPTGESMKPATSAVMAMAASPRAAALARSLGVSLEGIEGTGPGGRIIEADVRRRPGGEPVPAGAQPIPLSPMRRSIAERMARSMATAPHFYTTVEADMGEIVKLRERSSGFRPTFNDAILFATVRAIERVPGVNVLWDAGGIVRPDAVNLGFAVALDDGLLVPVIRHAQRLSLEEMHTTARALTDKAKAGRLGPQEYSGATFTVSNLGGFGADEFTAIIHAPACAILAVGRVAERPVVRDGRVLARSTVRLTLSSDHRAIDGALAATFMSALKSVIESGFD